MKNKSLFSLRQQFVGVGLLFGCAVLLCASAGAQNLLKNGSFENPIDPEGSSGTTNWVVVYAHGAASDWLYADRTTESCIRQAPDYPDPTGNFGASFGTRHWSWTHAYHKQIVTGLTPGASYTLSGYMWHGFDNNKVNAYIALLGGPDRSIAVSNRSTITVKQPLTDIHYFLTNTASTNGEIEVRLGLNQGLYAVVDPGQAKWYSGTAWFDCFTLTPTP